MSSMMTQSGPNTPADLDASARGRADRLARATADQMEAALALLSMLDPEAFEIAFTAIPLILTTATSPSRCAANAAAWSPSSPTTACGGSTSAATASRPPPRRSTSRAMSLRSPRSSPTRTRTTSSQYPRSVTRRVLFPSGHAGLTDIRRVRQAARMASCADAGPRHEGPRNTSLAGTVA
jgi:hypothetical protein